MLTEDTFKDTALAAHIREGRHWSENCQGTNALGLAIAVRQPVTVHGEEDFFIAQSRLTCTAVQIFASDGSLAGVIDESGNCHARQHHTMALARMAAANIECLMFRAQYRGRPILVFHRQPEYLRTASVGLLVLDSDGLALAVNRRTALFLQGLPVLAGEPVEQLFKESVPALLAASA
ncbi:hypothetical protein SAMN07250955_108116 [Arboricoccus pini]|uniref:Uncharacterized protein n=1 Tax=Arboricoccus pini TaxID=1963835 RepID=A0A212RG96_9PROT|nr:hypothetical protein [Arboricoccus pini]SNB71401.1 hypothetical protein SAMN07250955_108116 [Arboricoccus pini]